MPAGRNQSLYKLEREITSFSRTQRRKNQHFILLFYILTLILLMTLLYFFRDHFVQEEIYVYFLEDFIHTT